MYLSRHRIGWVPVQEFSAVASSLPINRLASVGATGVPMAAPFICLKYLPANSKVLSFSRRRSISRSMCFSLCSLVMGGFVGIACCNAIVTPTPCGIDG